MKFKDLNEGDRFIIPINPHIGLSKEEITELCEGDIFNKYMISYKKQKHPRKPQFNAIQLSYINDKLINIPDDEDVVKL